MKKKFVFLDDLEAALSGLTVYEVEMADQPAAADVLPYRPARSVEQALHNARNGWHLDGQSQAVSTGPELEARLALREKWMGAPSLAKQDEATREAWILWGWTDDVGPYGVANGVPEPRVNPFTSLEQLVAAYNPDAKPSGE